MKKNYVSPALVVIETTPDTILAGSVVVDEGGFTGGGSNSGPSVADPGDLDNGGGASKGFGSWDDED